MKLVQVVGDMVLKAKVYLDRENEEYTVRLWVDGVEQVAAKYFTDDLNDAVGTANLMTTK
jgi:hypothetical protein